jgi:HAD domain in Swiss Army Knife RNA repair proteins
MRAKEHSSHDAPTAQPAMNADHGDTFLARGARAEGIESDAGAAGLEPDARPHPSGAASDEKPLLMVDIDGVISLFGFTGQAPWTGHSATPKGSFHTIDGIPHFLSRAAADHLLDLAADFDLVWASGWEEKAEEYLPRLLGLPAGLPFLRFEHSPGRTHPHWKLAAIEEHAGSRALAWVDDAFNDACHAWGAARTAPTLLVQTSAERGLTSMETSLLSDWARALAIL